MKKVTVDKSSVQKKWMSQKEVQSYLGVGKDWIKDKREQGLLHFSVVGNTAFYIKSEIDNLIKRNAITGKQLFAAT